MQSKVATHFVLLACLVSSLRGKSLRRTGCFECEEEIWEEVPCHQIPSNTTIVTTTSRPILKPTVYMAKATTQTPSTSQPRPLSTPSPPAKPHTTTISPELTTAKDPYKKCYCECKLGCKEFCRKVIVNPSEKKIVQVSKISEPAEKGRIEFTQILQREFIPNSDHNYVPENHHYSNPPLVSVPLDHPIAEQDRDPYAPYYNEQNILSENYNSQKVVPVLEPIYGPYANDIDLFDSYPPYHSSHYKAPNYANEYDFPLPFESLYSKATGNTHDPEQDYQISLDASGRKDAISPESEADSSRLTRASVDDSLATFLSKVISR